MRPFETAALVKLSPSNSSLLAKMSSFGLADHVALARAREVDAAIGAGDRTGARPDARRLDLVLQGSGAGTLTLACLLQEWARLSAKAGKNVCPTAFLCAIQVSD